MTASYQAGRVVPGVLELEATIPWEEFQSAKRIWEAIPDECLGLGIDTDRPTHLWLAELETRMPELAAALSWVEAGLHEGFHLYQLLSTNYGRVRVANEHEILSIKSHAYDSMVRSGFKFAHPWDGGIDLSKMLLASPNPQFEAQGDMLSMFEEMQEHGEGFADGRLEERGYRGDGNTITANTLEEEAASFFGVYSLQGGDAVRTVGTQQRETDRKYTKARECFVASGGTDFLVLFAMIHLSFRYGSYTEEEGDHPVAIFATLIECIDEVNEAAERTLAEHQAASGALHFKSLADILDTAPSRSTRLPDTPAAQAELTRHPLNDEQGAAIEGFASLCEAIAEIIKENCHCLDEDAMEADDLLPRKPYFEGVWRNFNSAFPAWKYDWAIAVNLIQPFGTAGNGFMFWKSIRDVANFGGAQLDIGGVRQAYLAFDRLERIFQGKSARVSVEKGATDNFEAHKGTPSSEVGSINALLAESDRSLQDLVFDPYADYTEAFLELPGGFYMPRSLIR